MRKGKHTSHQHRLSPLWIFAILLIVIGFLWGINIPENYPALSPEGTVLPSPAASPTAEPTPTVETVRFSASGDNLIHRPIYKQAAARAKNEAKYDFTETYKNLADFYSHYDVNWINQESLVNNALPPSSYPCFSTPGECAEALYNIGFRVFSLSNNHTYDQGTKGLSATLDFWESMPNDVVVSGLWQGAEDYTRIPLQTINDITIAYLCYTEHTNGISISASQKPAANVIYTSEKQVMQQQIENARTIADVVVVGVHWGVEYSNKATDAQKALAQQFADWGADVIIGTHPHVLQDAQWLTAADGRQAFVAYSLGNFISTQDRTPRAVGGILTLDFIKRTDVDGSVAISLQEPKIHPIITHYDAGRQNVRNYLYRDYTPELAAKHGLNTYDSNFSYNKLLEIVNAAVSPEFIDIT